jgi:hypothetical protein
MTNTLFFFLILAVVLVVAVALVVRRAQGGDRREWPFYAKKTLSVPEQVLYHRLVKSLPECIILAQVQASRILGVKKGHNFHHWNNRINRLSLDYVVCTKDSRVIAAIELDDSSHEGQRRREADRRKEKALRAAGVPLYRWSVKALPDEAAIRAALNPRAQSNMALRVYCERGGYRRELRALEKAGAIQLVHFPYEGRTRRVRTQANPSKITADCTHITFDSSVPIGSMTQSEKFQDILRIVGKDNEFDARHLDSAYKSGCSCFLTPDKRDISKKSAELEVLLGLKVFNAVDGWSDFMHYVENAACLS